MNTAAGEELLQMLQMFFCGWLVMLTSHEKQALMSVGCFRRSHKTVIDFLFCILWALLLWLIILAVSGGKVRYYLVYSLAGGILMYCTIIGISRQEQPRLGFQCALLLLHLGVDERVDDTHLHLLRLSLHGHHLRCQCRLGTLKDQRVQQVKVYLEAPK